eukprot:TRINITY_DN31616_c0_g1_i1.p1 TRINITY_DN31616_c0_g1~~TRINITY_DN31616_c0_g1_i1.p1  ORF type:complete len:593 (+),score=150.59 TRINITY_DN31616_c0_g1_i1:132-1910(+)
MTISVAGGHAQLRAFRKGCQQGNTDLVIQLLQHGVPIDSPQEDGCTGLWLASEAGRANVVELLCQHGADTSICRNQGGASPLYVAAQNGFEAVVETLLRHGANPNQQKDTGATALCIASQMANSRITSRLIEGNAVVDLANNAGVTPLMIACYQGCSDVVKILIDAGADPNLKGGGKNAAEWAESNGTYDTVGIHLNKSKKHQQPVMPPPMPPVRSPIPTMSQINSTISEIRSPHYDIRSNDDVDDDFLGSYLNGPSQAIGEAEPSLAKLFKIKDIPLDLNAAVEEQLAQRAEMKLHKRKSDKTEATWNELADLKDNVPEFVRKEQFRSKQYKAGNRKAAREKRTMKPDMLYGATSGNTTAPVENIDDAWAALKYNLASMEDHLERTQHDVTDKWMYQHVPGTLLRPKDQIDISDLVKPSMDRIIPEISPHRRERVQHESNRPTFNPGDRPYQLSDDRLNKLAAVMGVDNVENVKSNLAAMSGESYQPQAAAVEEPPPVASEPARSEVSMKDIPVVPSEGGDDVEARSLPEATPSVPDAPPSRTASSKQASAHPESDASDDDLEAKESALLERIASRRSSRASGRSRASNLL